MDILEEFITVCRETPEKVFPWKKPLIDARELLKLYTKEEMLAFIGNGGLERVEIDNKKPWENNPNPDEPRTIHSYRFFSNALPMYIAFFPNENLGNWIIKSFHEPKDKNPTIAGQLGLLLKQKQLEEDS